MLFSPDHGRAATPYIATRLSEFTHRGEPPLRMPTGVAVAQDGTVFVADGVNDRLLQFDPRGAFVAEIRRIGDEAMSRPISVRIDAAGRLWVADTGHARVLVRAADGSLDRVLQPERGPTQRALDITDAVPLADGRSAWLADNNDHRLVLMNPWKGTQTVVGEEGEALKRFHYPFKLALGRDGDLLVVDVLNARVQVLTADGQPVGSIGTYGADLGQLYRPTAVATDREGNVWIADAVLGVVQVFTPLGELCDVLRDESGRPLKFDMPMDLAFDAEGRLYVAELLTDRVRKLAITFDPQAPKPPAGPRPRTTVGGQQARSCTICHLEWLEPFSQGQGTALLDVPPSSAEQPAVSRAGTCLSCHNGTAVDSRRRVWQEHGHATDVLPPPDMTVPPILPLVGGRVVCRTCHTAHAGGMLTGDVKTAVFLRVPGQVGELCILCHPDKTRGPELGTHPTGGMPWPVPQAILDAGGRTGPNPRELTCRVCHTPHGAAHEHLLVMGTESNQLCRTCHEELRPGMFREGASEHPLSPITTPDQAAAVHELGTKLGPEGCLICLSCHKLHHGKSKRFMLAEELDDGRFCLRCHEERRVLLGSPHDLRAAFPEEKNRLGMTPESGGPCSACHLFHRYARAPEASELDPGGGKCITCHQPARVAQEKVLPPFNHPKARCTGCHNPHNRGDGVFLAGRLVDVCSSCHPANADLLGGVHDITQSQAAWPSASVEAKDVCLACHRPHGTWETGLFRAGLAKGIDAGDAGCAACHADAARPAAAELSPGRIVPDSNIALVHPRGMLNLMDTHGAPVAVSADGAWQVACRSCHDPHRRPAEDKPLLRADLMAPAKPVCVSCHAVAAHIDAIGHSMASLGGAGFDSQACKPCHGMHASPSAVEPNDLWPKQLYHQAEKAEPTAVADQHCLACHRVGGPVAPPAVATHPKIEPFNPTPPDAPGFLPLFNERGEVDPQGRHGCRTCHLTHGRATPAPVPAGVGPLSPRELRARQWHLRTFSTGNVCATCHGFGALRRFMYFHDPARRGGPLETGPGAPQ
jgi:predicted CXXCH cytochrome family protein